MLVHDKSRFIRHIGDVRPVPGMDELSNSDIEASTKGVEVPLDKTLGDQGEIEILDQPQKRKTENSAGFSELATGKAVGSTADTFDLKLLEKWLEKEQANKNRTAVIKAIEDQIGDVENPNKDSVVNPE